MNTLPTATPLGIEPKKYSLPIILVTLITLGSTLIAGYITKQAVNARLERFFDRQADQIANTYYNKLHTHITILQGLQGLWNANGSFSHQSFVDYLSSLDLTSLDKSGVSSYFFIPLVADNQIYSFTQIIKNEPKMPENYQKFTLHPKSSDSLHYPVTYGYPLKDREEALGLDFGTFPERLAAINYTRDTGMLATTGATTFLTTGKPGFFFLLPLYIKNLSNERAPDRKLAFAGVIGAAFRSESAFEQIFGGDNPYPDLNFHIYQGDATTNDRLLYDNDPSFNHQNSRFKTTRKVSLQDQSWTIIIESKSNFALGDAEERLPLFVFLTGILATLFLATYSSYKLTKISLIQV